MGWEQRGSRTYYYTKTRTGRRVRSTYVGCGERACQRAEEDRQRRLARAAEREAFNSARDTEVMLNRELAATGDMLSALTAVALCAAGFHQHRGQWRHRRHET